MKEIVAAAIKHGEMVCFVPRPGRHHDIMRAMARAGLPIPITGRQGFVTSEGKFVNRTEARQIAEKAAQLIAGRRDAKGVPYVFEHPELFSEDVW